MKETCDLFNLGHTVVVFLKLCHTYISLKATWVVSYLIFSELREHALSFEFSNFIYTIDPILNFLYHPYMGNWGPQLKMWLFFFFNFFFFNSIVVTTKNERNWYIFIPISNIKFYKNNYVIIWKWGLLLLLLVYNLYICTIQFKKITITHIYGIKLYILSLSLLFIFYFNFFWIYTWVYSFFLFYFFKLIFWWFIYIRPFIFCISLI